MGASGSRAVRRNQAAAASVSDNLANLPATSAVRRDAVERVAFAEERLRQEAELNAKSLDEVSSEDTEMAAAMGAVMQVPDGAIHYKDHIIPLLDESEQNREMVRKIKEEMAYTESAFAERASTEEIGMGRVTLGSIKVALGAIQQTRGQSDVVERLAAQYKIDPEVLAHFAAYCSIPHVSTSQLGPQQAMVAEWQ